jgi:hypothetical protein
MDELLPCLHYGPIEAIPLEQNHRCLIQTGPLPPAGLAFGLQLQPHASYSLIIDGQELHKEARQ